MSEVSKRRLLEVQGGHGTEKQVQALTHALFAALQELTALRAYLTKKGLVDEELYREVRTETMLNDHNAAGAFPEVSHSYYRFLLDEEEFLRLEFGATDADVAAYRSHADHLMRLT